MVGLAKRRAHGADLGVPVGFSHDSLQHAVEWAEFHRRLACEVAGDDPTSMWNRSWLPWSYDVSGAALVIEARPDMPRVAGPRASQGQLRRCPRVRAFLGNARRLVDRVVRYRGLRV